MATEHSPRPALPVTSDSTRRQTNAPDRPKLRNSCHICASSKLKCSQDKPTCSRCAKRGLECEYVAAKQGGRRPNKRSTNENRNHEVANLPDPAVNTNEDVYFPSQANWFTSSSSNSSVDLLRSPGIISRSPRPSNPGSSDTLIELFNPMDFVFDLNSSGQRFR